MCSVSLCQLIYDKNEVNTVMEEVSSVWDFIEKIKEGIEEFQYQNSNYIFAYRGESQNFHQTSCMPGIFRENYLEQNANFERNILNEIKARNLSDKENLILRAVDAQHYGFPTRLLDITFDPLIALYFAVKEDGGADAQFFVFAIESLDLITDENISDLYEDAIKNNNSPYNAFNQRFIDFSSLNNRIQAQRGGFVLFPGDTFVKISKEITKAYRIRSENKEKILNDLNIMFGINDSRIYPEMDKFVNAMKKRAKNHLCFSDTDNIKNNLSMYFRTFYIELRGLFSEKKKNSKSRAIEEKILEELNRYEKFLKLLELTKVKCDEKLEDFVESKKKELKELSGRNGYVLGDCNE